MFDWRGLKLFGKVKFNFQKYVCLYLQTITMMICMSELDSTTPASRYMQITKTFFLNLSIVSLFFLVALLASLVWS